MKQSHCVLHGRARVPSPTAIAYTKLKDQGLVNNLENNSAFSDCYESFIGVPYL